MEVTVGRLQLIAFNHPVNWTNSTGGALAISHTALAAHFDFEIRLAVGVSAQNRVLFGRQGIDALKRESA